MGKLREKFVENMKADEAFCDRFAKQKNGMDYIPWSRMLAVVKAKYDTVRIETAVDDCMATGLSVSATVTVSLDGEDESQTAVLAVSDFKNKEILEPSNVEVQNTRQRAIAKALSMATGIGLSLWFGDN